MQSPETFDKRQLVKYWVIYSFLHCIEHVLHKLFDYLTLYWLGKCIFLVCYWKCFSLNNNNIFEGRLPFLVENEVPSFMQSFSTNSEYFLIFLLENETEVEVTLDADQQCIQDNSAISILDAHEADSNQNLNQLDPNFMYSQIFKEILVEIEQSEQAVKNLAAFCQKKYSDDNKEIQNIKEFVDTYKPSKAIWWYTRNCFAHKRLNEALRDLDGDITIRMGFFLRDLHRQIEGLHKTQTGQYHEQLFTVYRGQGLTADHFKKLSHSKGGLIAFNSFLSTSTNRNISLKFARIAARNQNMIGIHFEMTIDTKVSSSPFAFIKELSYFNKEEEILFSMHTVFRITDIQKLDDVSQLYHVKLKLTSDDDQQLRQLTNFIREEARGNNGWIRLGYLLTKIGQFNKAEELYNVLLEQASKDDDKANFYNQLGYLKDEKGQYDEAISFYEKSVEIKRKILPENDPSLATCYNNIGGVYKNIGNYPKALEYYQKYLKIPTESLPENHLSLAACYNNMGGVYKNMGDYSKALEYYQKDLEITEIALPENHPDLAVSYNNIGLLYKNMDDPSKALEYYNKALKIRELSLPVDHPDFAQSYNNIGLIRSSIGDFSRALEAFDKVRKIYKKAFPENHPSVATCYNNIGTVYDNMHNYSEALEYYKKALKIREIFLPENHPDFAMSYNNMGLAYNMNGDHIKALEYLKKAFTIFQKSFSSTHPNIKMVKDNINEVKKKL